MLTRPTPEFGKLSFHWDGGTKVILFSGDQEVDSIHLKKATFVNASLAMEALRHRLNKACQG